MSHVLTSFIKLFLVSSVFGVSVDCENVIALAIGLRMNIRKPSIMNSLYTNCCNALGVTCTSQRVTELHWPSLNLDGHINATALPSSLDYLNLGINYLTGKIPFTWPSSISTILLATNHFEGSIPLNYPSTLLILDFSINYLTGTIPDSWPLGLLSLDLSHNFFHGGISGTWPVGLTSLFLYSNRFTGPVSLFPSSVVMLMLGFRNYPGNQLSGSVLINKPNWLQLTDNLISSVVIQDTSDLSIGNCDFSNNPLLNSPNISQYTMCFQGILYPAALASTQLSDSPNLLIATSALVFNENSNVIRLNSSNTYDSKLVRIAVRLMINLVLISIVMTKAPISRSIKQKFTQRSQESKRVSEF